MGLFYLLEHSRRRRYGQLGSFKTLEKSACGSGKETPFSICSSRQQISGYSEPPHLVDTFTDIVG